MATNASPFIVNIVDLQNIAINIRGTSSNVELAKAQSNIANIQEMVNYSSRTISTDFLKSFTSGQAIDVLANLNLSNASLFANSNLVNINSSQVSTLGLSGNGISVNPSQKTISFTTAGTQSFLIDANGNGRFAKNLYVGGNAYVTNVIQTSDVELKINVGPFTTTLDEVLKLQPRTFQWNQTGSSDLGFVAQEVQAVWPCLTETHPDGTMGIVYSRFIPLLLESIRELNARVLALESRPKNCHI